MDSLIMSADSFVTSKCSESNSVLRQVFHVYLSERSQPDMKRDGATLTPLRLSLARVLRKVQTGSGSGNGADLFCKYTV